ncbi:cysteine-rich receptor-like protein kinase 15 isoform X2 [Lotus japonicus]|uniref:cysteine-rich receptor-like protein kinase 15 isoform X2 n=1 Tax=Lotus japonicus TaxID=34305 RepID=UPI00258CB1BB|nr:cysteine-rich receptor-like protein kinase 15 isoform X2 [Lotus japonicus]
MNRDTPSAKLSLIIFMLLIHKISGADPVDTYCPNEFPFYTPNSSFHKNLKLLMESLSSNTASKTGFYNTSVGEGRDKVYGQALCRGDITNSTMVCQQCIQKASQDIMNRCSSEDAMIWYEFCQVRYSFQMFFSRSVYTGKYPQQNDQEKNVSDPIRFEQHVTYLMNNLSDEAAFNPAKNMFAAGEIRSPGKRTIVYGLVQCTRDMSGTDCSSCLSSALTELTTCCSRREGGIIVSRNCNVRFDLSKFFNTSSAYLLTYPTSKGGGKWKPWMFVLTICGSILILAVVVGLCTACLRRRNDRDRATIKAATGDFSDRNKLGQGGFGEVYKGVLSDGNEIAVKRLSRKSWQGMEEFKNEIMLIAKLQHRNLVRLLGCVLEGDERMLVYEFMSNKSLDQFIFDAGKRPRLDWKTCQGIINGIARGLVYLHEESRLKIIHRDLKPNNVLLDHELVAKISDFGMARIFSENQNAANTKRVVGTYGYMAPEYAMEGLFSVKSDVFSFGVILLEIISGKRNNGFYLTELAPTLLAHAWQLWNEGKESEFVDPLLRESCLASEPEVLRCVHIGLLCVQQDPEDRPTMSDVVALLGSESTVLPQPSKPSFPLRRVHHVDPSASTNPSVSEMMWSSVLPR